MSAATENQTPIPAYRPQPKSYWSTPAPSAQAVYTVMSLLLLSFFFKMSIMECNKNSYHHSPSLATADVWNPQNTEYHTVNNSNYV
jgi:hypothetical protein